MAENYHITEKPLNAVLNNNINYSIPDYQRSYEWKKDQTEELWNDLMGDYMKDVSKKIQEYLLGPIVISYTNQNEPHYIVDGQQRLVTLTLLFCAIRKLLQEYSNEKETDYEKQTIRELIHDIDELTYHNDEVLIKLNDSDTNYAFERIQRNQIDVEQLSQIRRKANSSTKKIIDNYDIILKEVRVLCENCGLKSQGTELIKATKNLTDIIDDMKNKNFFVHVTIHNDDYSHQVFESLNSKGTSLYQSDLIKSHLLKISTDKDEVNNKWQTIMSRLNPKMSPDALLYESILSRLKKDHEKKKEVSKKYLYKYVKDRCNTPEEVKTYLRELDTDSEIIKLLNNPEKIPQNISKEIKHSFYSIQQLRATYFRRPVIAACREWKFESIQTKQLVDCLLKFFFMYRTISGKNIDKLKKISVDVTSSIMSKKGLDEILYIVLKDDSRPDGVVDNISQEEFDKEFKNNIYDLSHEIAKYILISFEHELWESGGISPNIVGSKLELEHIFPQKPNDECLEKDDLSDHKNRLGNLTLLPEDWNNKMSNHCFKEKMYGISSKPEISYINSGLKLNEKYLKQYEKWTLSDIEDRENNLCALAKNVWNLSTYTEQIEPVNVNVEK